MMHTPEYSYSHDLPPLHGYSCRVAKSFSKPVVGLLLAVSDTARLNMHRRQRLRMGCHRHRLVTIYISKSSKSLDSLMGLNLT